MTLSEDFKDDLRVYRALVNVLKVGGAKLREVFNSYPDGEATIKDIVADTKVTGKFLEFFLVAVKVNSLEKEKKFLRRN